MSKLRLIILLMTIFVVGIFATLISLYARGYRLNSKDLTISPNGLLVIKSYPDGAQVYIDGELKTATNNTLPLLEGVYDVSVKKEGFLSWNKRLTIEKEVVTEATAHLFKAAPSLTAVTFAASLNAIPSYDLSKIAYLVPTITGTNSTEGLWIIETVNLPLGFARDPRRVTDGDLSNSTFIWSPDGREILLTTSKGVYLLDTTSFTSQSQRVNVASQKETILFRWQKEKNNKLAAQMRKLPSEFQDTLGHKAKAITFSPDEEMVLYTASGSAAITPNLIKQLPGSSSQKQERNIEKDKTYVYDIKEDRNFLLDEHSDNLLIEGGFSNNLERRMSWYPSSRHVVLAEKERIVIMDYDGTNRQIVYSGSYLAPHAYPTLSFDRLLILTNLGASTSPPNLYSLGIK